MFLLNGLVNILLIVYAGLSAVLEEDEIFVPLGGLVKTLNVELSATLITIEQGININDYVGNVWHSC